MITLLEGAVFDNKAVDPLEAVLLIAQADALIVTFNP
jgi:hypothetical protein